jgi:hypothetical protein
MAEIRKVGFGAARWHRRVRSGGVGRLVSQGPTVLRCFQSRSNRCLPSDFSGTISPDHHLPLRFGESIFDHSRSLRFRPRPAPRKGSTLGPVSRKATRAGSLPPSSPCKSRLLSLPHAQNLGRSSAAFRGSKRPTIPESARRLRQAGTAIQRSAPRIESRRPPRLVDFRANISGVRSL